MIRVQSAVGEKLPRATRRSRGSLGRFKYRVGNYAWATLAGAPLAIRVLAGCVLASLGGLSVAAAPSIYVTGYEILPKIIAPSMYWLDNSRLLFAGLKTSDMDAAIAAKDPTREKRLKKLYIWDARDKSVHLYADRYVMELCYANGRISYITASDYKTHRWTEWEGTLGSEQMTEKPWPAQTAVRSIFTCKTHDLSQLGPPAPKNRSIVVLREDKSYLDLGPAIGVDRAGRSGWPMNLTLYNANDRRALVLPMTWDEDFSPLRVRYSRYMNAYVVSPWAPRGAEIGRHIPWPRGEPLVVYLLWVDGRTERTTFPYWPAEYLIDPHPIRGGWIFGGGKLQRTAGLHFFDGSKVTTVDLGFVKEIAVSSNGCMAAVAIQNRPNEMGTPDNVKVFRFCTQQG